MDASVNGNETAGEVPQGQAPAPEVPTTQGTESQAAPITQPWRVKVGDTEYDEQTWKTRGVEDLKRIHGEYTRSRQELSRYQTESDAGRELLDIVRNDPQLFMEVKKRLAAGQSPQQAVNGASRAVDQADPRVDSLHNEMETLKQERATESFRSEHPDLTPEDEGFITDWVAERAEKLRGSGWSYKEVLDQAYYALYHSKGPKLQAQALQQGQEIKEKEIVKGRQAKSLGTVSPTAQAAPKKTGPTSKMRPSERTDNAMSYWQKNARKG